MATIKVYLYCVKAGKKLVRYSKELFEKELDFGDEQDYEGCCNELGLDPNKHYHVGKGFGEKNRLLVTGDEGYYMIFDKPLNGTICFECDCKEAFNIYVRYSKEDICKSGFVTVCHDEKQFYEHSKVSFEESHKYFRRFPIDEKENVGFAYHFENVKPIEPMPITQLYRDGTMVYPLTRAPQSYCFAYRKAETTKEDYLANVGKDESRYYLQENGKFFYSEKFLVFSIRSPWLCKIANGEKDLEVRKTRILNAGIEYK